MLTLAANLLLHHNLFIYGTICFCLFGLILLPIWAVVLLVTREKIAESRGRSRLRGTVRWRTSWAGTNHSLFEIQTKKGNAHVNPAIFTHSL